MSRPKLSSYLVAVAALVITAACSDPGDGTDEPDASQAPDAGADTTPDGPDGEADAAPDTTPDGAPDTTPDGAPDAVADAAPDATSDAAPDARPDAAPDAGAPDAGAPDARPPDAGVPDAGAPDAGVPDAGVPGVDELTAIVALNNCSGSVVRLTTSRPTDRALVLTNGHCISGGFLDPGEAVANQPSTRQMSVLEPDSLLPGAPRSPRPPARVRVAVRASELVYATMTTTDIALYRLTITYEALERDHDVHAMTITDQHPVAGTPILIPSGYWRALMSCSIDTFVYALHEGEWTFEDSIRFHTSGCETIGGTSGSPIVATATHEVIGINNTANEGGVACSINNPCEVDEAGNMTSTVDGRYGQQVYLIYDCLSPTNELDFDLPGCRLPPPTR
jgi:hypothetical protein